MPVTNYIWDVVSDNVLMEKDDDDETIARYVQEPSLYGEAISQERGGETRYYNYDGEGNTSELTDANQNVTDSYEYSAFGEEVARTGSTENPFGYKGALGYYTNGEMNDIYVRARTYEPTTGRWLSLDPIGFLSGTHRYQYVHNAPINFSDPSGLFECCCCCVDDLQFTNIQKIWSLEFPILGQVNAVGHKFTLETAFKHKPGPGPNTCSLEWQEYSTSSTINP